MPYYPPSSIDRDADVRMGLRVERSATSVAAASTKSIFTVATGNVIVYGILAESTTGQAAGANAVTWISTPTTGTAINLSGGVGDIVSQEAGGFVSLTGVLADNTLVTNAGAAQLCTVPLVIPPGVIGFATAGNTAGSYKFTIWYVPAEDGAYVTTS
jgi:hypothetical protein